MTVEPDQAVIAVATSIPPRLLRRDEGRAIDDEYQLLCIRSWLDCGFRILSINDRQEIPELSARYPEVTFIATDRNASAWTGRKNPYVADLLLALLDAPEPVIGVINSDIIFEPSQVWRSRLPSLVREAIVVGHRYDTSSLRRGAFERYYDGFDFFFFDRSLALSAGGHAMPFAMGLPWWDHWLPCVAVFNQRRIVVLDRPSVVHLAHRQAFSRAAWQEFAHNFANFVIGEFQSATHALPEIVTAIVPACREIAVLPRGERADNQEYRRRISKLANVYVPLVRQGHVELESGKTAASDRSSGDSSGSSSGSSAPGAPPTLQDVFHRFDKRFAAEEAVLRTLGLLANNKVSEIGPDLIAAMNETPQDFNVLLVFAEIALRRNELEIAHDFLSRAGEQQPDSVRRLHLLGIVLNAMGRNAEAKEGFQKLLQLYPEYQTGYTALAKILWETGRRREAFVLLERAVKRWPEFHLAAALHERFGREFKTGSRISARLRRAVKRVAPAYIVDLYSRRFARTSPAASRPKTDWPPDGVSGGDTG